jgi:hypothetical protein
MTLGIFLYSITAVVTSIPSFYIFHWTRTMKDRINDWPSCYSPLDFIFAIFAGMIWPVIWLTVLFFVLYDYFNDRILFLDNK